MQVPALELQDVGFLTGRGAVLTDDEVTWETGCDNDLNHLHQLPRCRIANWRPWARNNKTDLDRAHRRQPDRRNPDGHQPDRNGADSYQPDGHPANRDKPDRYAAGT
jgi:hypothetical protein